LAARVLAVTRLRYSSWDPADRIFRPIPSGSVLRIARVNGVWLANIRFAGESYTRYPTLFNESEAQACGIDDRTLPRLIRFD